MIKQLRFSTRGNIEQRLDDLGLTSFVFVSTPAYYFPSFTDPSFDISSLKNFEFNTDPSLNTRYR